MEYTDIKKSVELKKKGLPQEKGIAYYVKLSSDDREFTLHTMEDIERAHEDGSEKWINKRIENAEAFRAWNANELADHLLKEPEQKLSNNEREAIS